jgi:hypothetical protein
MDRLFILMSSTLSYMWINNWFGFRYSSGPGNETTNVSPPFMPWWLAQAKNGDEHN